MTRPRTSRTVVLLSVLIGLIAAGVYLRTAAFEFISVDDPSYVTANPHVTSGLTLSNISWAFTTGQTGNWHPVTWISHMVDAELYGRSAGGHHVSSVVLHAANAVLLFLFLVRATGAVRRSAFVALVFAVHVLNVESVAWIAERKNVLSTLFWLLTLLAYLEWARRRGTRRYVFVLVLFALGLMAKPMLVTLPLVLVLVDFWPLGRWGAGGEALLLEKFPLGALAAASATVTMIVQRRQGLTISLEQIPLGGRVANAIVSYARYLQNMAWPSNLCILYPHPLASLPAWQVAAAGLAIAVASGAAILLRRRRPYVTVGWFWYLVTLVPVIGFVQVGAQAMADRYAYVPLIGIFMLIAWGVADLPSRPGRGPALAGACALILALTAATVLQQNYWRDDGAVARRAIAVNPASLPVTTAMTATLFRQGKGDEALRVLGELPNPARTMNDVGQLVAGAGMQDFALRLYREAVDRDPGFAKLRNNYGVALAKSGDLARAREQFSAALRLEPGYPEAQINLRNVVAAAEYRQRAGENAPGSANKTSPGSRRP